MRDRSAMCCVCLAGEITSQHDLRNDSDWETYSRGTGALDLPIKGAPAICWP